MLERGAHPNDGETLYHGPETHDNKALKVLVESGKLNGDSLSIMLLRKTDWHDYAGMQYPLECGADPNRMTRWGVTALHQALRRDNDLKNIELLLDHGADPILSSVLDGKSSVVIAAHKGRGEVVELFNRRGIPIMLEGVDGLISACATNDAAHLRAMAAGEPDLVRQLLPGGGTLLAEFAGTANTDGIRRLLEPIRHTCLVARLA